MDRPPFKVLGNRTLIEIAERRPKKLSELAEIKGITELLLRRLGRDVLDAVRDGRTDEHGPLPEARRRAAAGAWIATPIGACSRSSAGAPSARSELALDPGVLCPNSALEAIAWRAPNAASDLEGLPELKGWFVREFGAEVVAALALDGAARGRIRRAERAPETTRPSGGTSSRRGVLIWTEANCPGRRRGAVLGKSP